jgi:uncharacterized membrane protein
MDLLDLHPIPFAFVLAIVFAIVVDVFSFGSRIRTAVRQIKNKRAERSIAKLRERIRDQEDYQKLIPTDRSLYLRVLITFI